MDTVDWKSGKVQGAVYDFDEEIIKVSTKAYEMFMVILHGIQYFLGLTDDGILGQNLST